METSSFKTIRDLLTPHIRNQTQVIHQEHDSASNYANLLNSFESLQDPEEDNFSLGFSNGLASALLLNALTSISIRLKRKSIDQWRRRAFQELNLPPYYKEISSASRMREDRVIQKMMLAYNRFYSRKLTRSFYNWKIGMKKLTKEMKVKSLCLIGSLEKQALNFSFEKICEKTISIKRKTENTKQAIRWAITRLYVSSGLKIKKAFRKWYGNAVIIKETSQLNLHVKVCDFKNYQSKLISRLKGIYQDSANKKMHLAYFEWKKWAIERAMLQKAEESMMIRNIMSTKRLQSFNELQENMEEQRDIIIQAQIERHLYDFGIDAMNGSIQLL